MADRIVAFYSGRGSDHAGRSLEEILAFDDARLEAVHDFIQWLFPLAEPSPVNPHAPTVTGGTRRAFAEDAALRANLERSLLRMLAFYGLDCARDGAGRPVISPGERFGERARVWLHPNNHNHLRLTRILKSLRLLGLPHHSAALRGCLERIAADHPDGVTDRTLAFWRASRR